MATEDPVPRLQWAKSLLERQERKGWGNPETELVVRGSHEFRNGTAGCGGRDSNTAGRGKRCSASVKPALKQQNRTEKEEEENVAKRAKWHSPGMPATREAEAGEWQVPGYKVC